jgi:peptidoglycan/LPS O-acetylase OafA/YrhL
VLVLAFWIAPHIPALQGPDLSTLCSRQAWAWLYGVNILNGIKGVYQFPYMDHFWSLAVEEHFYFVWPLVIYACSSRFLLPVTLGVGLASLGARIIAAAFGVNDFALHFLTPLRLDALCSGAALAIAVRQFGGLDPVARGARHVLVFSFGVYVATFAAHGRLLLLAQQARWTFYIFILAYMLLEAVRAQAGPLKAIFSSAPLRFFGKYSYGLYVYHHFLSYYFGTHDTDLVIARWVGSHTLAVALQATFGVAISIAVAVVSYHLYESKFLALKEKWGG